MVIDLTSTSLAAGGHAGGGEVLAMAVYQAIVRGVALGAHPSYPDRAGFGRTSMADRLTATQLEQCILEQMLAVGRTVHDAGGRLTHVKAHGALYHDVAMRPAVADAFATAVARAEEELDCGPLVVMGPPLAGAMPATYLVEGFADRRYLPDGNLAPRTEAGSVLTDVDDVVEQATSIAIDGRVRALDGTWVDVPAGTLCLHGDTPDAVALARAVRTSLLDAGVQIRSYADTS